MRLDSPFFMSLSNKSEQAEKAIDKSESNAMVLSDELELPARVANVSRDELRKYAQCKRVGNYLLGRTVGEGSFAKVKEAIHILTGEKVAIKIIDKNRARKDRYVSKNMRREARLLQMIRHPHIVQLLEIVETSQCYYLVFEFADGGDLMDHICKRKKLEETEVRKFIRQIISAVEYLHRLGIMHRDLKVENLLLDANKNIKIIDFGLSNTIYSPDSNSENHCSTQCGSPAYAAPELLVRKDYGPQIDVWSIGVNLYAMLTGRLPYTVEPFNISTLYNKMLRRQMNAIPEYLSEDCKDMIHKLLNPDPKERLHILEAIRHRWITMDERDPLVLVPCPNYLREEDLDDRILDHVEEQLKLNSDDIIRDVIQNKATKNSCIYHLLVRRLERYQQEERKLASEPRPTIQLTESKSPPSSEHISPPSPNHHSTTQKNGLVKCSSPKTHIMENPFKTIKVALIRQKKAVKNEEKSKAGKTTAQDPTTNSEATNKPKLCAVRRVALVKFSPARRSLRGLSSLSRNCTNSPKPGRRKSYFESLQQRRKSPKVRRRYTEPDDSLSSSVSTSRRTSIDSTDNKGSTARRMRTEDTRNNNTDNSSSVGSSDAKLEKYTGEILALENIPENSAHLPNKDPGTNTPETVTHLFKDKAVVLKRNSSVENCKSYTQEGATVQHHVLHGGDKTRNIGGIKDEQGRPKINGDNSQKGVAGNAKISSVANKTTETTKLTSQRLSASNTPTTSQITKTQPLKTKTTLSKQTAHKVAAPRKTPYKLDSSSKIPVMAGKNSVLSHQFPKSPTRSAPKTVTPSIAANTKLPGTAARRNDVARLADKYDKCVSVVVVGRPTDVGKSSATVEKEPASNENTTKGTAIKGLAPKVERLNVMNDLKNRNGLNDKIKKIEKSCVTKGMTQTLKEQSAGANLKSRENNTKRQSVEEKEIKEKTIRQNVERLRNGLQRQKIQDQPNRKLSLVKPAKESLNASRNMSTTKDIKQTAENARKNSTNERTGKVSMVGQSTSKRASVKSQETTEDTKSWTEDARRKISNYRKTDEAQQKMSAVKREAKTVTNVRSLPFKTS